MRYDIHTVSKIITEDPNLINQEALNEATIGQNLALGAGLLGGMMGIGGQTANAQTPQDQTRSASGVTVKKHATKTDISWVKPQHIQRLTSEGSLRQNVGDDLEAILSMYNAHKGDESAQAKIAEKFGATFGQEYYRYRDLIEDEMESRGYKKGVSKPRISREEALGHYDKFVALTNFAVSTGIMGSKSTGDMTVKSFMQYLGLN